MPQSIVGVPDHTLIGHLALIEYQYRPDDGYVDQTGRQYAYTGVVESFFVKSEGDSEVLNVFFRGGMKLQVNTRRDITITDLGPAA